MPDRARADDARPLPGCYLNRHSRRTPGIENIFAHPLKLASMLAVASALFALSFHAVSDWEKTSPHKFIKAIRDSPRN
jgi:hypothetical protein